MEFPVPVFAPRPHEAGTHPYARWANRQGYRRSPGLLLILSRDLESLSPGPISQPPDVIGPYPTHPRPRALFESRRRLVSETAAPHPEPEQGLR